MRWSDRDEGKFKKYKDIAIFSLLILILTISLFNGSSKKTYVLSNGTERSVPDLGYFCESFINQILNKKLQQEMVEHDIYDVLISENYKILNLVGREQILFSRAEDQQCSVIIQDQLGLRRFEVTVNTSSEYPFHYKVQKVDEPQIEG